jgi:hypothetical protein
MMSSNLSAVVQRLRERAKDNETMPPFGAMPKNEPLIIEALLTLADEVEKLRQKING